MKRIHLLTITVLAFGLLFSRGEEKGPEKLDYIIHFGGESIDPPVGATFEISAEKSESDGVTGVMKFTGGVVLKITIPGKPNQEIRSEEVVMRPKKPPTKPLDPAIKKPAPLKPGPKG